MKFFIPAAESTDQAEQVYQSIRGFVGGPLSPRRVYKLTYTHNGKLLHAEVGKPDQLVGEMVVAILFRDVGNLYFVCTANRGVIRGGPIFAGGDGAVSEDFE